MIKRLAAVLLAALAAGCSRLEFACNNARADLVSGYDAVRGELSDAQYERVRAAAANRAAVEAFLAMLADLERTLSARQRGLAVARLRVFARDFELLAAAR